ncbi:MAG: hypothetical protein CML68_13385 [Rhodobacteraceae bacterium]|nr:hypothetical protein [Paracoccaceae bacterium]
MTDRFQRALPKILMHEGGYVNHPADPGGATNKGITQNTYTAWLRAQGRAYQSVKAITDADVAAIYRRNYWDAVSGDDLPSGVGYCVFDAAVNSGPRRAAEWLQQAVGADPDGAIGPITLAAVADSDNAKTINAMCDNRMAFLKRLRHWPTFKNGWTRRVSEVREQSLAWVSNAVASPSPVQPVAGVGKGEEVTGFIAALAAFLQSIFGGKA